MSVSTSAWKSRYVAYPPPSPSAPPTELRDPDDPNSEPKYCCYFSNYAGIRCDDWPYDSLATSDDVMEAKEHLVAIPVPEGERWEDFSESLKLQECRIHLMCVHM